MKMAKRKVDGPYPYEMSPEQDAKVQAMTEQADRDIEEHRVNMRWGGAQLAVVKRAAEYFGMPYQTYVKQAAFRQAMSDLQATDSLRK